METNEYDDSGFENNVELHEDTLEREYGPDWREKFTVGEMCRDWKTKSITIIYGRRHRQDTNSGTQ